MANPGKGNAIIGQSGGPTSVINQSLVGVIQEIQKSSHIGGGAVAGFIHEASGRAAITGPHNRCGKPAPVRKVMSDVSEPVGMYRRRLCG